MIVGLEWSPMFGGGCCVGKYVVKQVSIGHDEMLFGNHLCRMVCLCG